MERCGYLCIKNRAHVLSYTMKVIIPHTRLNTVGATESISPSFFTRARENVRGVPRGSRSHRSPFLGTPPRENR